MKKNKVKYLAIGMIGIGTLGFLLFNAASNFSREANISSKIQNSSSLQTAYFAGGCFWCTESAFEKYDGVVDAISGYAGGTEISPGYREVASGKTGHREAVKVIYDPELLNYNDLLEIFWRTVNPTDGGGQYVDRGFQYTSAIFYTSDNENSLAISSKKRLAESGKYDSEIITPIIKFTSFYLAEEYHQNYYKRNPIRYNAYTNGSGRKKYLQKIWGDDLIYKPESQDSSQDDLRSKLTPLQYYVTQEDGTEPSFKNEYWDNTKEGIYVDIVDGTPLFSSLDKYKSGTGWPSFSKPLESDNIVLQDDYLLLLKRTEVRSKKADSHLGHLFDDGPQELGGLRYCMNSAAMKFIPKDQLVAEGYGLYLELFQ